MAAAPDGGRTAIGIETLGRPEMASRGPRGPLRLGDAPIAFLVLLVSTAAAAVYAVLVLAGPHGGVLPPALHPVTLALAWCCVFVIPLAGARWVWRRYSRLTAD